MTVIVSAAVTFSLAHFFYRSVWAVIPLSFAGVYVYIRIRRDKERREKEELVSQFRECILAVAASHQAVAEVAPSAVDLAAAALDNFH